MGFTHKTGDIVTIAASGLGALANRMKPSSSCEPWSYGLGELMTNLAQRGLLSGSSRIPSKECAGRASPRQRLSG
jgi:hypothetical protein